MKGGRKDKAISFHKIQLSLASAVTFLDGQRDSPACKEALPSPVRPRCSRAPETLPPSPPPPPPQLAATARLQQALAPTAPAPGTIYLSVSKSYVVRHASVKSGGVKKQTCNKASFGIKQSPRREARQQTTPDLSHFFEQCKPSKYKLTHTFKSQTPPVS